MRMKPFVSIVTLSTMLTAGMLGTQIMAEESTERMSQERTNDVQADNSEMNKTNRGTPNADQAKNTLADRETMQKIRKSIMDDESLSVYAQNIKVIAQNGRVTLKGVVHTLEEKNNIGTKATDVAGNDNVTNKITVKGS